LLEERKLFGIDHCQAGRSLVVAWRLPDEFLEITSRHHDANEQSDSSTTLPIHYSCRIADALGFQAVAPLLRQTYEQLLESIPESCRLRFTFNPKDLSVLIGRRIKAIETS
jgi:HD-like signal output (HDOD) protein